MKKSTLTLVSFLCTFTLAGFAQKTLTANDAADSMQTVRNQARRLYNKQFASKQDIDQGITLLNTGLKFLEDPKIQDLAGGSLYLQFRRSDMLRELAYAYALNHQYPEAIKTLNEHFNEGTSAFMKETMADSAFLPIKNDPKFIAIGNKYTARTALWAGNAFKTPYQANLSDAEKIAGLSLLWSQARANFVYFDHLPADWNQTYMDFIPQVTAAKSTLAYYRVLQKFYAQLHDGHTNVYFPKELSAMANSRPPIRTELIEGRVFITAVNNDSLQKAGIVPGLELIKIDAIPVKQYADTYVKPYQSSSTPQDMDQREYTYFLLAGDAAKPVTLELKDKSGKVITKTIARSGYPKTKAAPAMTYREINQIGYLTISNFEDNKIVAQFDSLFNNIAKTKGLIIDVRYNGGGDSGIGDEILARLTDKPFDLFAYQFSRYVSRGGEPSWANNSIPQQWPNKKHFYNKPVVMLVNGGTFSAAEDFTVAFDYMKRGKLIGLPTGGSTGQPIGFSLPGGGSARVCGKKETYPDGKEFVDVGVMPDITINKTIADFYTGKDAALSKALEILK